MGWWQMAGSMGGGGGGGGQSMDIGGTASGIGTGFNQTTQGLDNMISWADDQYSSMSGTQTSFISQEGLNAMLEDLLGSVQGLAAVTGAERSSGMYDSSANTLMVNDLISRLAGQVAQNNRTNTTTQTQESEAPLHNVNEELADFFGW